MAQALVFPPLAGLPKMAQHLARRGTVAIDHLAIGHQGRLGLGENILQILANRIVDAGQHAVTGLPPQLRQGAQGTASHG